MKQYLKALLAVITLFLIDQISKWYALRACSAGPIIFSQYVACNLCFNSGSCWSLLSGTTIFEQIFLFTATIGMSVALVFQMFDKQKTTETQTIVPEILILAGAVGNLADRMMYGGVVDFIELSYGKFHWPVFNCADSFVVIGVVALLIQLCTGRGTRA
jgi:signal peptidase II